MKKALVLVVVFFSLGGVAEAKWLPMHEAKAEITRYTQEWAKASDASYWTVQRCFRRSNRSVECSISVYNVRGSGGNYEDFGAVARLLHTKGVVYLEGWLDDHPFYF